jgi:peptidoglycan/xylan/chitin deacetylase (PgdA/CDA1 family)
MFSFQQKFNISKIISSVCGKYTAINGCRALMYHSLKADVVGDLHGIYQMDKHLFQQQMQWLHEGFGCNISAIDECLTNNNKIAITFDDGYRDTFEVATPILKAYNMPFTVFVAPGLIQSGDQRYLDRSMLIELSKIKGCTIGAHGYSHIPLTECNDVKLHQELVDSKKWLEDLLSIPIHTMSYPYGAVDQRVRDAVERAGYKIAASSIPGGNITGCDTLRLNRTDIWAVDKMKIFSQKVNGRWDWMRWII